MHKNRNIEKLQIFKQNRRRRNFTQTEKKKESVGTSADSLITQRY